MCVSQRTNIKSSFYPSSVFEMGVFLVAYSALQTPKYLACNYIEVSCLRHIQSFTCVLGIQTQVARLRQQLL